MKAAIIVFSPSGHTLAAARMIQRSIEEKGGTADIINITKDDNLLFASKSERQKILLTRIRCSFCRRAGIRRTCGNSCIAHP